MSHPWRTSGQKRTIKWSYEAQPAITRYLEDMQDALKYVLQVTYWSTLRDNGRIPSPITLRREVRDWFFSRYRYAHHHVNPVCRAAVALIRGYRKTQHGRLGIPQVQKLAMRIDTSLFKLIGERVRITLEPRLYVWIPINTYHKRYGEYSKGRASELFITDNSICLSFSAGTDLKVLGDKIAACDLNMKSIDVTSARIEGKLPTLTGLSSFSTKRIVRVQNDYSRRTRRLQRHVQNKAKRIKKLMETRGRQGNRIKDVLHKISTELVRQNPGTTFVFENLRGITTSRRSMHSKVLRTKLSRWPHRVFQRMVEYKSSNKVLYVSPRGTSSECPVCGGKLEHPTWADSRCMTCDADYGRDRLASLAILVRGLRLCGYPFTVSADASWQQMRDEYLYAARTPDAGGADRTDVANAPNSVA